MIFANLLRQLPNGLHDAVLRRIIIDLENGRIVMDMDVSVGTPEQLEAERDRYEAGVLTLAGVRWLRVDPVVFPDGLVGVRIDAGDVSELRDPPNLPVAMPGEFVCWFFLADTNSFLYCAASHASFAFGNAGRVTSA